MKKQFRSGAFHARRRPPGPLVFALVLLMAVVAAGSAFADDESLELPPVPSSAVTGEILARFEAEETIAQREIESPAAAEEREESSDLYTGLAASEAEQLLATAFSSQLESLNEEPVKALSDASLIRPLGEGGALIAEEGQTKLIEGTVPVLAPEGGGKIDLSLEGDASGFEPANPLVDLHIPSTADEGIEVGEEGMTISQAGATGEANGRIAEDFNVFYPEVHTDTDLLVTPTATGVELFNQLRSDESPETLRFHLDLPEGALLRSSAHAAEVIAADGSKLATIPPPSAVDAQGSEVPVQMRAEGDSLVLDVIRTPGQFAYPILVDPIIQEWYYQNWYQGYNLQALQPWPAGPWRWETSEGASSSYVYGSTKCITSSCWGSGRGLYMATPNGNIPANRWGQWYYAAPNPDTYLGNAWIAPFWVDDHGNCPISTYGQPYNYVGMYNETSYNRVLNNEARKPNDFTGLETNSWGRSLVIGMGNSSAISIPCWRDVMVGGARIWLEDYGRPTLTTTSSGEWMDTTPIRLNVSATDAGLGVQRFRAKATNASGGTEEWWTTNSCTGLYEARCPETWNLTEGSQPKLNIWPEVLPEGVDKLTVTAYDAAWKPSYTDNEMTVRIDHSGPTVEFSGTLTEQEALGTERNQYKLHLVILDGDPEAKQEEHPERIRSGLVRAELETDGQLNAIVTPKCAGEPDCGYQGTVQFPEEGKELSPGQHTFKVRAKDALGHVTTKELKFTIAADRTAPALSAGPLPGGFSYVEGFGTLGSGNGQLNHPADVALDSKGNVWALDKGNSRISQFNEKGEWIKSVGSAGTTGGKLSAPAGLAIDPSGNLWVADTANNRIEEFNEKGEFVLVFGKDVNKTKVEAHIEGAESNVCTAASGNVCQAGAANSSNGGLKAPQGIAATSGGNLWVADTGNSRIQKFGPAGNFLNVVNGNGTTGGPMKEPSSIAMGPDGSIWVADTANNRIEQWTSSLSLQLIVGGAGFADGQFEGLGALDIDAQGNIWAADITNNRIEEFNEAGTFIGRFGLGGSGAGQLNLGSPTGVAVDSKGNIFVADGNNNRIQKWARPEAPGYASSFGTLGSGNGQLNHPADVALDSKGNVWALDKGNSRISQFNEKGEWVKSIGSAGTTGGKLSLPSGLAIDPSGNLWVADTANNRIEKFNEKGEFVLVFGKDVNKTKVEAAGTEAERNACTAASGNVCQAGAAVGANGGLKAPQGIAATSGGNLWIADTGNSRLLKYSPAGTLINIVSSEGTEAGKLKEPSSIAIGPDGSIWVADSGNNRIELWNSSLAFIRQFGSEGTGNGQFKRPSALEVDAAGNVWVGDQTNNRVEEFNEKGEFLRKLGSAGTGAGQFGFGSPIGLAVDAKGNLWIADGNNNRVQKWFFPTLPIGPALEPITAYATDRGSGVTALTVKLLTEGQQPQMLASAKQVCEEGGCSMKPLFDALDLSERPAGIYTLVVEASDGKGNSRRISSRFALSPAPPQLALSGALAEGDGQPMTTAASSLSINASEAGSNAGIRKVSVEVDNQQVARRNFNCSTGCQEVATSFRYNAARDGADRSIEAAADPSGAVAKTLNAVSCLNANDCTAVGYYRSSATNLTLVEHWNGSSWQVVSSPNPAGATDSRFEGVSCVSSTSCTAVGYFQDHNGTSTLVEKWNGTTWSIIASPNRTGYARNYLYGVSCVSSSECWAVGKSAYTAEEEAAGKAPTALLERWNGTAWSITMLSQPPTQLNAVSCFSATSCMAVGGASDFASQRWNGTSWTRFSVVVPTGGSAVSLNGVACPAVSDCTAVGSYSSNGHTAPLAERWNGSNWSVQQTTDPTGTIEEVTSGSLGTVSCPSTEACTAVGSRSTASETAPLVEGWDGTDWALEPAAIPSGIGFAPLRGVSCAGAFNCYAVGLKGDANALIEREVPDRGSKTVTVEATDRYGNATSKSIQVDVPPEPVESPECDPASASTTPKGVVSATEATSSLQNALPQAVAASEATTDVATGKEIDPSFSQPKPNLESLGTPTDGEAAITPQGGFTIDGVACFAPTTVTSAAAEAKVVNGDAAVFANTAPETDTLLRPNAAGMTMVQSLRGSSAPTTISWNVTLNPDENMVELPSGAVAITRDGTEATGETAEVLEPEGMQTPAVLADAQLQLETAQYEVTEAESETTEEVIMVIPPPWALISGGSIIPLKVEVLPDVQIPTEFELVYVYPRLEPSPEAVIGEIYGVEGSAGYASSGCTQSPCGDFVVSEAVQYAKRWGKPERNPEYPNFYENNCTNFLSQIMTHGGMGYMRQYEKGQGSWWVKKIVTPKGTGFESTESWRLADKFPRHLWEYRLADIDTSNESSGWQTGDILAEDWYGTGGKGDFNHVQFVSGTRTPPGQPREPLIANSSEPDSANYAEQPWIQVKARIAEEQPDGWNRVPLVPKHRFAKWDTQNTRPPAALYDSNGVFPG
jgi:tripartite motif-containing protein 71